jgi:TusE/DsrC/DsvC family sulfur relay protein
MPAKRKSPKRAKSKAGRVVKKSAKAKPKKKGTPSKKRIARARIKADPAPQLPGRPAPRTMYSILHPGAGLLSDPDFRDAPEGWTRDYARKVAAEAGINLTEDHWEVIRVLQGCYKDEVSPRIRLLRDALEARFGGKGGMKYLFGILLGGPIAQGCALAGLKPPGGAKDSSFGSVA